MGMRSTPDEWDVWQDTWKAAIQAETEASLGRSYVSSVLFDLFALFTSQNTF